MSFAEKGWPLEAAGLEPEALGRRGWNLLRGDLPLPCAVLKQSALASNSAFMGEFLRMTGAKLCPHGKTTMSPQLMRRQIADGAWGITAANARQMSVMHAEGIRRVLIANQVVGAGEIAMLSSILRNDPAFDLYVLVDSVELVRDLDARLELGDGQRLQVLLERGQAGGRTGARTLDAALATARAVKASRKLSLRGVEAFEGILHGADDEDTEAMVRRLYADVGIAARACEDEGLFVAGPVILSGGGSGYYDLAAEGLGGAGLKSEILLVIRSGCYLTHDSSWMEAFYRRMRERSPDLTLPRREPKAALEVWGAVQSCPEPGLALVTLGKRDVSYDVEMPKALAWFRAGGARPQQLSGHVVTSLNDQHAYLSLPADSPLRVGDMVCFGISHPCTTFDKWRTIAVVDDDYGVIDAITTAF